MKNKILQRLENYKENRKYWTNKQTNHKWTQKERDMGSELYGSYQEKEQIFTYKILELEWVLSMLND